ncbi:hypothetical protein SCUCBS95973_002856 [Sporothrix curviconia]|uniref:Zn(2)-C6 fungal-type domain-containing protein n=1 Tax=Sporothrix curviconia TaxID=1260050 RepID=A0ABP0BAG8_9PEZI
METTEDGRPANRRRTRTGCMTCRARKIKCDEAPAPATACRNCTRARLECIRADNGTASLHQAARSALAVRAQGSPQHLTQAGLQRRRTKRSCTTCRLSKKRCGGERPQCVRCTERDLGCIYDEGEPAVRPGQSQSAATLSASSASPQSSSHASTVAVTIAALDKALARELSESFFTEVAPLRCHNFLHRHMFLQELDALPHPPAQDMLVLSVCALATKTMAQGARYWDVGCTWAREAQRLVMGELEDVSVRRLMCLVLLYEHANRTNEQRLCFLLSGLASRFTQALSLNLEYDHDVLFTDESARITAVARESRRRLMWACYILDTMLACGLRDLQAIDTSTLRIQLPCDDRHFLYKRACVTATVPTDFLSPVEQRKDHNGDRPAIVTENQGLDAFLVRLYLIRDHVLQYINSNTDEQDPWRVVSLLADLDHWKEALTPELQLNADVMAVRQDEGTLAALVSLHVQYHQVNCLLYRCTIPSMLFPARVQTGLSVKASPDFLEESRKGWFGHACAMTAIFEVALQHQPAALADHAVAGSAYNAIIIKWLYLTNFVPVAERPAQLHVIRPLVEIDLQFLQTIQGYHATVRTTAAMAAKLVDEASQHIAQNPAVRLSETGNPHAYARLGRPLGRIAPDYRMNRLSAFARMRRDIPDRHAPDPGPASPEEGNVWAGEKDRLWMWTE